MPKKKLPTPEYDSERETRVLLEKMNQGIQTVAEQHGSIVKKLEQHDGQFEKLNKKLEEHDGQFGKLNKKFDGLEATLNTVLRDHEQRIKKVEEKIDV